MEVKNKAIFAGSFDPFTKGHLAILKRALKTFKEVTVLVAINDQKKVTYSLDERIKFIKLSTKGLKGVKVDFTNGLTVDYAKKHHIYFLLRGVRDNKDYEYEEKMSKVNQKLNPNIITIVIECTPAYKHISSTLVKNLKKKGEGLSPYVSKNIIKYL